MGNRTLLNFLPGIHGLHIYSQGPGYYYFLILSLMDSFSFESFKNMCHVFLPLCLCDVVITIWELEESLLISVVCGRIGNLLAE